MFDGSGKFFDEDGSSREAKSRQTKDLIVFTCLKRKELHQLVVNELYALR